MRKRGTFGIISYTVYGNVNIVNGVLVFLFRFHKDRTTFNENSRPLTHNTRSVAIYKYTQYVEFAWIPNPYE